MLRFIAAGMMVGVLVQVAYKAGKAAHTVDEEAAFDKGFRTGWDACFNECLDEILRGKNVKHA